MKITAKRTRSKDLTFRLTVRFDPKKLGNEKTAELIGGLTSVVGNFLTEAQRKDAFAQLARAQTRLNKSKR